MQVELPKGQWLTKVLNAARPYLLPLAAAIALIEALVLAWLDRTSAAALVAGVFALILLFHNLPSLESFKALGVEAKLRARLNEADKIINDVRNLSITYAQQAFLQLAWMNRVDSAFIDEKVEAVRRLNELLKEQGVPDDAIAHAKQPFIAMIMQDIYLTLRNVLNTRIQWATTKLDEEYVDLNRQKIIASSEMDTERTKRLEIEYKRIADHRSALTGGMERYFIFYKANIDESDREYIDLITHSNLSEVDIAKLRPLGDRAVKAAKEVRKEGNIGPAARYFIDPDEPTRRAAILVDIFGNDLA